MIELGRSRVGQHPAVEAFQCLVDEIEAWRGILDRLEAGHAMDRAEGNAALGRLLETSQRLRDTILSIDSDVKWETKEELCQLVSSLDTSDARRARYEALAQVLQAGTVLYRREKKRAERLQLRDDVVNELRAVYALASPPELPGPEIEAWLEWAWGLEDDTDNLRTLQKQLPLLYDFVTQVESELWQDGTSPSPPAANISLVDGNAAAVQPGRELVEPEAVSDHVEPNDTLLETVPVELPEEGFVGNPEMEVEQDAVGEANAVADKVEGQEAPKSRGQFSTETGLGSKTIPAEVSSSPQLVPAIEIRRSIAARFEASAIDTSQLVSFENFREHHLLTFHGSVSDSPWMHEGFRAQLDGLISENLSLEGLPRLLLAVRAANGQGWPCLLNPEAVRQAACLVRTGKSLLIDQDDVIFNAWRDALLTNSEIQFEHNIVATHGVKLLSVVYAFSSNSPLNPSSLLGGRDAVQFTSPALRTALEIFAQRALTTNRWVEHLQDRLDSDQTDRRQTLTEKISSAKEKLRAAFRDKTVLRGIERPHCREAWAVFMKKVDKERTTLLLDAQRDWGLAPAPGEVERWATIYTRTMDAGAAKYKDRNKMDRAFQDLNDQANALAELLHTWNSAPVALYHGDTDSAAIGQLHSLLASDPLADPEEELCRLIIQSVLRFQRTETIRLDLTLRDFLERPQLLELLDELPEVVEGDTEGWESCEAIISIDNLREPVRVVARFLEGIVPRSEEATDLLSSFREALLFCGRGDLQDRLIHLMEEPEKRKLWSERRQEVELLQESANLISDLGGQLSDFTDSHADQVRNFGIDLREIAQTVGRAGFELLLMKTWSQTIADTSKRLVDTHSEALRHQAHDNPAVLAALAANDFGLATMLSGQGSSEAKRQRLRETTWRNESKTLISDPQAWLGAIAEQDTRELSYLEKAATNLAGVWLKTKLQVDTSAKKLRTAFLDYVFQTKRANSNLKACFIDKPTRHFINCQVLRSAIRDEGANPSYLPQLADIPNLAVVTPENVSVSAIINSIKNLGDDLCVVLAPRVSEQVRRDVRQAAKTKLVAVIDHLDLCRLLELRTSTEMAPLLGLLEIVLEQQSWDRVDPYRTQDGQHVRMEMFVGRAKEGEQLARTNDFKKLFSGRKLGKSALLRYVQDKFDCSDLPSGNELRVLYLPIVDHFRENDFVECLVTEIQDVCGWRSPGGQDNGWPRLHRVIRAFLEAHPKTSLLIVLDEADKFVEEELKSYLRIQEACLSFHLRSTIETAVDGRQLPRVRFLFAGYRTTNLSEGAWSNWGETLRLSPLDPTDATALLAGPLARVGIDLRELAGTVAYRCGYQPAVLLRAGKALLTRMAKQRQVDSWEYIQVRKQDTTAILEENQIRDEIRQVIDNNFTQNKLGEIVFHTSILLLSERQFGYALEDPEDQIMAALERRDPNGKLNSWLKTDERSAKAKITEQLEELQQRRLLVSETAHGEPVRYRLAFPHHVSALGGLQQLSARLQQEIHDLPSGALNPVGNGTLCFFAADEVDSFGRDLKESAREPKETRLVRALLAVSHWLKPNNQNPALHPSCGMGAQIGYTGATNREPISAEAAAETISIEDGLLLLTGGADLLRWGLAQSSEDYFYAIAPIRRFGPEELKAWFGVLYEIELTPRQLEGMHRLTGGIPLLVGELNRLILPFDDVPPPDKLDEAVWSRVQADFSLHLPSIARELRDGTPEVRLSEREIEILKMVIIASEYANATTLSSDLTVAWDQFDRPDLKALSVDDEVSVTLLQDLGLIPMRRAFGLGPIQAIRPVEQDDALRRMIDHL